MIHQTSSYKLRYLPELFCICWSIMPGILSAQDSLRAGVQLAAPREYILGGAGALTTMTGYWLQHQVVPLTPAQIHNLRPEDIPAFDRYAAAWRPTVASLSDYWVLGTMLLPATLMLHPRTRQDAGAIALVYAETFSLNTGLTLLTKVAAGRTRPYVYLDPGTDADLAARQLEPDARLSFYSGHTSSASAISFMTARLYSLYFPNSRAKPYVWAAAAVVPGVAGWMRVRAGKHFPSDVVAGYLTGMAIGITVPSLHQSRVAKRLR